MHVYCCVYYMHGEKYSRVALYTGENKQLRI